MSTGVIIKTADWNITGIKDELRNESSKKYEFYSEIKAQDNVIFQLKIRCLGKDRDIMELYIIFLEQPVSFLGINISYYYILDDDYSRTLAQLDFSDRIEYKKWYYLVDIKKKLFNEMKGLKFDLRIIMPRKNTNYPVEVLINNNKSLLNNDELSDVTVKSSDGHTYKAHKFVLRTQSAVLKAHFAHITTESMTNIVEVPFESDVVQELLSYIYCGEVLKLDVLSEKLLAAADFYQLDGLKHMCAESLHKKLTVDNAHNTLELAELHNSTHLAKLTANFIADDQKLYVANKTKQILKKHWNNLSFDSVKIILKTIVDLDSEDDKTDE